MPETKTREEKIAAYPSTEKFRIKGTIPVPHPYCITAKHVGYASDHSGGILSEHSMEEAEKHGARCGICKGSLTFSEHKTVLLVEVKGDDRELKDIPELKDYLLGIKSQAEADGYAGFAFIKG